MAEFQKVTTVDELSPGQCLTAVVNNRYVAVFNVDGTFHATDGSCPHQAGLLGNGKLYGCVVTCPEHGFRFDVTTGVMPGGGLSVKKCEVKVEGGEVFVAVE
jgi:nitrite reductase/ring-hydroxylating ferredoxin subunit